MTDVPSLFRHATSELSQDAFLAWLFEWADASRATADPALHRAGRRFLDALAERAKWPAVPAEARVRVLAQHQRIDLLVIVDEARAMVIEDKVHALDHHNPLEEYRQRAAEIVKCSRDDVACVYLKTGDQSDLRRVRDAGYAYFGRARLLHTLEQGFADGVRNDIYADFLGHLRGLEGATTAWRTTPPAAWGWHDQLWRGFLDELQEQLGGGGWGFVNNAAGGFYALWWGWQQVDGGSVYLQVDSCPRLGVRVWVPDESRRRELRVRWQDATVKAAAQAGLPFHRPKHPKSGKSAAVANFAPRWIQTTEDGALALQATVDLLRSCTDFVRSMVQT